MKRLLLSISLAITVMISACSNQTQSIELKRGCEQIELYLEMIKTESGESPAAGQTYSKILSTIIAVTANSDDTLAINLNERIGSIYAEIGSRLEVGPFKYYSSEIQLIDSELCGK